MTTLGFFSASRDASIQNVPQSVRKKLHLGTHSSMDETCYRGIARRREGQTWDSLAIVQRRMSSGQDLAWWVRDDRSDSRCDWLIKGLAVGDTACSLAAGLERDEIRHQ
ncbi:hypothetical protein FSOLCH5_010331 [Fusarium solani]